MAAIEYKKALAFTIINRAIQRKITFAHFAHLKNPEYSVNPDRIKKNPSLVKPLYELALHFLPLYNKAVINNNQANQSYNYNILDILPDISNNVDLIYFDPPYCGSHADYQAMYHFLETFINYDINIEYKNQTKRYWPPKYSGFDKKKDILNSFDLLFQKSANIPYWILSYNDNSYPNVEDIKNMLLKYKDKVKIEYKKYDKSYGGKGSIAGSHEILFVCD